MSNEVAPLPPMNQMSHVLGSKCSHVGELKFLQCEVLGHVFLIHLCTSAFLGLINTCGNQQGFN